MYQRILVPYDGSATSKRGLAEAIRLAQLTGGKLLLVHVIDELLFANGFESGAVYVADVLPAMRKSGMALLESARAQVQAAELEADVLLFENSGARMVDRIVEQALIWKADLIVIGTHGRRGVARMLIGSDAEQILRLAPVPVLLVRSTASATA
jgi:nucleotide-binding universal stress UspA family protein